MGVWCLWFLVLLSTSPSMSAKSLSTSDLCPAPIVAHNGHLAEIVAQTTWDDSCRLFCGILVEFYYFQLRLIGVPGPTGSQFMQRRYMRRRSRPSQASTRLVWSSPSGERRGTPDRRPELQIVEPSDAGTGCSARQPPAPTRALPCTLFRHLRRNAFGNG